MSSLRKSVAKPKKAAEKAAEPVDPSVPQGYAVSFLESMRIEFRSKAAPDSSEERSLVVRILENRDQDSLQNLLIELYDETNLYSLIETRFTRQAYMEMQSSSKLNITFEQFPAEIGNMLRESQKQSSDVKVQFYTDDANGGGVLEFCENLDLRAVEIFSLNFQKAGPDSIHQRAQLRFQKVKSDLKEKREQYEQFMALLKRENPLILNAIVGEKKAAIAK